MVTNKSGIALGILTADCAPILFGDEQAGIIGAAHAGWRGALGGVVQAIISAMVELGATPGTITAAIGPTISATAYEVGPELRDAFLAQSQDNDVYFTPSERTGHFMFNLPGYLENILKGAGLKSVEVINACTYKSEQKFFSYRRTTHQKQADYGRQISAITLGPAAFLKP
jgi:YfiH family protein